MTKGTNYYLSNYELLFYIGLILNKFTKNEFSSDLFNLNIQLFHSNLDETLSFLKKFQEVSEAKITASLNTEDIDKKGLRSTLTSLIGKEPTKKQMNAFKKLISILKNIKIFNELLNQADLVTLISSLRISVAGIINISFELNDQTLNSIRSFLKEYLRNYQAGNLHSPIYSSKTLRELYKDNIVNIISENEHLKIFLKLFQNLNKIDSHSLKIDNSMIEVAAKKHLKKKNRFNPNEIRPIESLLLMQEKGYIEILECNIRELSLKDRKPWAVKIKLLRTIKEITSLEKNWIRFGNLAVREDSGHVVNGNIRKHFKKDNPPFKALVRFIKNPEKRFAFREIECFSYGDKTPDKNLEIRIKNLISKGIIDPLQMNKSFSRVNILGSDNAYFLTAIPS